MLKNDRKKENSKTGTLGEEIACRFLVRQGYKIVDRNYKKKFGEIDIIARKNGKIHFIEVKMNIVNLALRYTTRPEERVDKKKLHQIGKAIRVYLLEKHLEDSGWYFKVISILFDPVEKVARVKVIEDVVPE